MKTKLVLFTALFALVLIACEKDKFTTTPQVSVKTISPDEVSKGDVISFRSSFTDEEGDLDSVYVLIKYYDGNTPVDTVILPETLAGLGLPPKLREGDLFIKLAYGELIPGYKFLGGTPVAKDTTVTFGIIVVDKEKNQSEYAESKKIRFLK